VVGGALNQISVSAFRDQRLDPTPTEVTMVLDEAYDSDLNEASLEQDAVWLDRVPPELEWDESDISTAVADLVGGPLEQLGGGLYDPH
jgi:hypothetical protein